MKKMLDLIRVDLIGIKAAKSGDKIIVLLAVLTMLAMGFVLTPLTAIYCPIILGGFLVQSYTKYETKHHGEKLFALLPIGRNELVNSRFFFIASFYIGTSLIFYLLMMLSLRLKLYNPDLDVVAVTVSNAGGAFTEAGLCSLFFSVSFSVGMFMMSGMLRNYFRCNEIFNITLEDASKTKYSPQDIMKGAAWGIFVILLFMVLAGAIPIGAAGLLAVQMILQLARTANGSLFCFLVITVSFFEMIYQYICTQLEYSGKEL